MELGSVAQTLQILTWAVIGSCIVYGDRASLWLGGALALSAVFALVATFSANMLVMVAGMPVCAVLAAMAGSRAALVVMAIYAARAFLFSVPVYGSLGMFSLVPPEWWWHELTAWEINLYAVAAQVLITSGTITGGMAAHSTSSNFVISAFRKYDSVANRAV